IATATGDFNGDGKPDIVGVGVGVGNVYVLENHSVPGTFSFSVNSFFSGASSAGTINLWDVEVADVDGDQKLDIVVPAPVDPTNGSFISILSNVTPVGGILSFASAVAVSAPGYTSGVDVADLDFDGFPQLLVGS